MPIEAPSEITILIVGGSSAIGRAILPAISKFATVLTAGRTGCDIFLDLAAPLNRITIPEEIDVVIHTAANFGGPSIEEMIEAENINAIGTLKICAAAFRARAKHLIFLSSILSDLTEDTKAYSFYSLSKRHAEEAARLYCSKQGMPLTILKPSQVYGNGDTFRNHQPLLYGILDAAKSQSDIHIHGTHDACKNYIHIDDLTAIILRVIQARPTGTYYCTHPENSTCMQIAKAALRSFNNQGNISFLASEPSIQDTTFNIDHSLYDLVDFYPKITIEEGIERIANLRHITA